jgi:hypothetical protein
MVAIHVSYSGVLDLILSQEPTILTEDFRVALGGLVVIVLSTGPKVRGFKPGRGRWIFMGD